MTKKIATKLALKAVFLLLLSCNLASSIFGSDAKGVFDFELELPSVDKQEKRPTKKLKTEVIDKSETIPYTAIPTSQHLREFNERIEFIYGKYVSNTSRTDLSEIWITFFSLLEEKKRDISAKEIEEILYTLPAENQNKVALKDRLISWYENYAENLPTQPNLALSAIESRILRHTVPFKKCKPPFTDSYFQKSHNK
ncbi:MAG: hypothetical protein NT128_02915 [Proteobacteria bacterium]|nr:hypothetical protein [Pseudomonadota bacterium]